MKKRKTKSIKRKRKNPSNEDEKRFHDLTVKAGKHNLFVFQSATNEYFFRNLKGEFFGYFRSLDELEKYLNMKIAIDKELNWNR